MNPTLARFLVRLALLRPDCLRVIVRAAPLRVVAPLLVETSSGGREPVPFLVDSGSSISIISLAQAQCSELPIQGQLLLRRRKSEAGPVRVIVRPW